MNPLKRILVILFFLFIIPSALYAWQGKVVGITDGDTIVVLHDGKGEKIRLYGIDTPEKRQAFGRKAKLFTSNMVFGKDVRVSPIVKDFYERTVGFVYLQDGRCLNEEIIRAGLAWVYTKYCKKDICDDWRTLEQLSRQGMHGLWTNPDPVPPWKFRHGKSSTSTQKVGQFDAVGVYHGHVKSLKFHSPGCRYYGCKNCTAIFNSRDAAINAGYVPCKICKP